TAARLSLDLIQRSGLLQDGKLARTLERSLTRLRAGVEDSLLDEVIASGGLRVSRVDLAPVLAGARSDLANGKKVQLVVEEPERALQVSADPRSVRRAVRGLLSAAVEVARPGTVVRVRADRAGDRARVAVEVAECKRLAGHRLPDIPALSFARRAAR